MEHPARKITKIAREAERVVLLAMRRDDVGTAEIDLIHAVRHHPGITQTELAQALHADKPAIARRTAAASFCIPPGRRRACGIPSRRRKAHFTVISWRGWTRKPRRRF